MRLARVAGRERLVRVLELPDAREHVPAAAPARRVVARAAAAPAPGGGHGHRLRALGVVARPVVGGSAEADMAAARAVRSTGVRLLRGQRWWIRRALRGRVQRRVRVDGFEVGRPFVVRVRDGRPYWRLWRVRCGHRGRRQSTRSFSERRCV